MLNQLVLTSAQLVRQHGRLGSEFNQRWYCFILEQFICSNCFMVSFKQKWVPENVFVHSLQTTMQSRTLRSSNYRAEALAQFMFLAVLTSQVPQENQLEGWLLKLAVLSKNLLNSSLSQICTLQCCCRGCCGFWSVSHW